MGKEISTRVKISFSQIFGRLFNTLKENLVPLSTITIIIFTVLCFSYTKNYFSHFDINLFMFGDISDSYKISLSLDIVGTILFSLFFIITYFMMVSIVSVAPRSKVFRSIAMIIPGIILSIIVPSIFFSYAQNDAERIKNGLAQRYKIRTDSENNLCYSIIAGTSEYLFLWNYPNRQIGIILRSTIVSLELMLPNAPLNQLIRTESEKRQYIWRRVLWPRYPPWVRSDREKRIQDQDKWYALLEKKCSERIKPEIQKSPRPHPRLE